jgi:predicted alpha/beta-fold hydrolase
MRWLIGLAILLSLARTAFAAEQDLELSVGGHTVLATLRTPATMQPETPLVVMTHGTLAHKDMDTIRTLAQALADRGIASLAHTLALGLARRKGMSDCAVRPDHVADDAVAEIGAWAARARAFTTGLCARPFAGGNQVARYLATSGSPPLAPPCCWRAGDRRAEAGLRTS